MASTRGHANDLQTPYLNCPQTRPDAHPDAPPLRPHGSGTHFRALLGRPEVRAARSRLAPARLKAGTMKFFPWVTPQTLRRPCSGFRSRSPTPRPSLGQGRCQHPEVAAGAGLLNLLDAWEPSGFVTKPMEPFSYFKKH